MTDQNKDNKDKPIKKEKLTAEEEDLKNNISDMITGLLDADDDIQLNSYNLLKKEIISATETMTSIPKPLKFLKAHYDKLREVYLAETSMKRKKIFADILCVVSIVVDKKENEPNSLGYIVDNELTDFYEWGQELIRIISGEISSEYMKRLDEEKPFQDLTKLAVQIVAKLVDQNNIDEGIDLLVELDLVDEIKSHCKETNFKRVCHYLLALSNFSAEYSEQRKLLEIIYEIYSKFNDFVNALIIAIKLKETLYIKSTLANCTDRIKQVQMAFILSRARIHIESDTLSQEIIEITRNIYATKYYKKMAKYLDILEPKVPEDIFKSHLEEKKDGIQLESSKINMSASIVNGFINAGFGTEKLLATKENDWLVKNKEEGLLCSLAGVGLTHIWDIESGPNEIEKYMDNNEMNPYKRGGYNLGLGIISSNVYDENNVAFALLEEQVKDKK